MSAPPIGRKTTMRRWITFGAGILLLALTVFCGCAYMPHDGDKITDNKANFVGFALSPEASVRIEVQLWDGTWTPLKTVKADKNAFSSSTPKFKQDVYQWSADVFVSNWLFNSAGQVTLRAEQLVGSNYTPMFMYDNAGWNCLVCNSSQLAVLRAA